MLAECLRHGTGTAVDVAQAVIWYRKAALMLDAKVILGDLFYFGHGVPRNLREALHWYKQAAVTHEDPLCHVQLRLLPAARSGHGARPSCRDTLAAAGRAARRGGRAIRARSGPFPGRGGKAEYSLGRQVVALQLVWVTPLHVLSSSVWKSEAGVDTAGAAASGSCRASCFSVSSSLAVRRASRDPGAAPAARR